MSAAFIPKSSFKFFFMVFVAALLFYSFPNIEKFTDDHKDNNG